ncbi:MarR family transcriptional regulator [Halorubrum sp. Ib24]|uniref:MarR family transcriptional regulator n=1 Tax=Halorubrum sp. Ib24 TaxID=1383850 RepID=UPI003742E716
MSIDRDTFEKASEDELEELSVPDQVLGFLAANDDRAFKAREIASQIGLDEGAVSTALSRLKDRDLVEHKATYWAITDDTERLDGYSGYERATALFNQQLGTEDKESRREHTDLGVSTRSSPPTKPHKPSPAASNAARTASRSASPRLPHPR